MGGEPAGRELGVLAWMARARARWQDPDEVLQLVLTPDGQRVAARLSGGRVRVWDAEGRRVWSAVRPGLGLGLSPDGRWLAPGDGVRVDLETGGEEPEPEGVGLWVGDRRLWVGPQGVRWEGEALAGGEGLAPSPDLRRLPGPAGWVALVDRAWEGPAVLGPGGLAKGVGGPVQSAAWLGGSLYTVQDGLLRRWDPAGSRGPLAEGAARRPHALQTLGVGSAGQVLVTVGLEARGWALRWGEHPPVELPGAAPERPTVLCRGGRAFVSLWDGVARVSPDAVEARLELPLLRRRRRPLSATPELVFQGEDRVLLGSRPPRALDPDLRVVALYF